MGPYSLPSCVTYIDSNVNMHHYHQQLKTKTSNNLHKNFSRHNLVNSDVSYRYVKIIQLVDKYSLVLMT